MLITFMRKMPAGEEPTVMSVNLAETRYFD